jgi:hypothetical protein
MRQAAGGSALPLASQVGSEQNRAHIPLWPEGHTFRSMALMSQPASLLPTFNPSAEYAGQSDVSYSRSTRAGSIGDDAVEHFLSWLWRCSVTAEPSPSPFLLKLERCPVNSLHARVFRRRHPHSFGQMDTMATLSGVIGSSRVGPAQGVMHTLGNFGSNNQVKSKIRLNDEDCVGDTEDGVFNQISVVA